MGVNINSTDLSFSFNRFQDAAVARWLPDCLWTIGPREGTSFPVSLPALFPLNMWFHILGYSVLLKSELILIFFSEMYFTYICKILKFLKDSFFLFVLKVWMVSIFLCLNSLFFPAMSNPLLTDEQWNVYCQYHLLL